MSGVQDANFTPVVCSNCDEGMEEWASLKIENILKEEVSVDVCICLPCLDMVSLYLGIDFDAQPEGMFRINAFGAVEGIKKDNN